METQFKIGDLVGIKPSADNKLIKNCPPGIIIKISKGYPVSPEKYNKPRIIATILWDDGVEEKVDIDWLMKLAEL